jgi:hypothetical protein
LQKYNRPTDGHVFILLLVGHPGDATANEVSFNFTNILCRSFNLASAADHTENGVAAGFSYGDTATHEIISYSWDTDANGVWDLDNDSFVEQRRTSLPQGELSLLIPQPLNLLASPEYFAFMGPHAPEEWNGLGFNGNFFDPAEANGPRHPFSLQVQMQNENLKVNVSPIWVPQGSPARNVLIGMLVPQALSAGKTVELRRAEDDSLVELITVDSRGQIVAHDADVDAGDYLLVYEKEQDAEVRQRLSVVESLGTKYFSWGANQT